MKRDDVIKNIEKDTKKNVTELFSGVDIDKEPFEKLMNVISATTAQKNTTESAEKEDFDNILWNFKPEKLEMPDYGSHLLIEELGCRKKKADIRPNDELYKSTQNMAKILAAYGEDFSITMEHFCDKAENKTRLIISSKRNNEIHGMLCGAFGQAKTASISDNTKKWYEKHAYAAIKIPFKKDKNEKKEEKITSWCELLSQSFAEEGNYSVTMRFCPVKNVDERLKKLCDSHNALMNLAENNFSYSSNIGVNRSNGATLLGQFSIPEKLKNFLKGIKQASYSYSGTFNENMKFVDKYAATLAEEFEAEIYRLKSMQESCAWAVELSISADNDAVLQTVACIVSGALKQYGMEATFGFKRQTAILAGTKEILPMLLLPTKEYNGLTFKENEEFSVDVPITIEERSINIGEIIQNGNRIAPFRLSEKALNRHAFVCGMTGSGKTNTMFNILENFSLPFLVIEPVKGEYRALSKGNEDVNIFTMKVGDGNPKTKIMQMNPFWFPKNANIAFHIDSIKTIISSAFDLSAAMPNILEQCLYNVYINSGWDLVSNKNIYENDLPEEYLYPTFSDLCREVERYLESAEFGAELMGDYKGAMLSRLRSFTNGFKGILLNTRNHPDYNMLKNGKNIIELEGLADDADKCLVMGTILIQYYEYLKLNFNDAEKTLKHLVVIEEAHRLLKNVKKQAKKDGPDMIGQLVETLSNIMAEIRAFGEGFIIVDQSPSKISPDVIKNSATKIIHRIDDGEDIKILQSGLLIPEDITSIPSLKQGEVLLRSEGMIKPCKIKINLSEIKEKTSLAESFNISNTVDSALSVKFAATSVLDNSELKGKTEALLIAFLLELGNNAADK